MKIPPKRLPRSHSLSALPFPQLWELSIRDVRAADAGAYECQVASHPLAALFFLLRVVGEWLRLCALGMHA